MPKVKDLTAAHPSEISDGCVCQILHDGVSTLNSAAIDASRWHVFFADERLVPLDDQESNFKACYESFLKPVCLIFHSLFIVLDWWEALRSHCPCSRSL